MLKHRGSANAGIISESLRVNFAKSFFHGVSVLYAARVPSEFQTNRIDLRIRFFFFQPIPHRVRKTFGSKRSFTVYENLFGTFYDIEKTTRNDFESSDGFARSSGRN